MAEEYVRRRRRKFDENLSTLLLSNVYFFGNHNSKFILIGYSAVKDMKPLIVFCYENSYVEFTMSDWIIFTSNSKTLNDWVLKTDPVEHETHITKNVTIKKVVKANNMYIQIQNNNQTRPGNLMLLNYSEYNKCLEMNQFIQNIMRTFQGNWLEIEDYYNYYIHRCNCKKKNVLEEQDFFTIENPNFDVYRLFKEISIFCLDKLQSDVSFN